MQASAPVTLSSSIQRLCKVVTDLQRVHYFYFDLTSKRAPRIFSKPVVGFKDLLNDPRRMREIFSLSQDGYAHGNSTPLAFARFYSALNPPCLPNHMRQQWERAIFKGFQAELGDFAPLLKGLREFLQTGEDSKIDLDCSSPIVYFDPWHLNESARSLFHTRIDNFNKELAYYNDARNRWDARYNENHPLCMAFRAAESMSEVIAGPKLRDTQEMLKIQLETFVEEGEPAPFSKSATRQRFGASFYDHLSPDQWELLGNKRLWRLEMERDALIYSGYMYYEYHPAASHSLSRYDADGASNFGMIYSGMTLFSTCDELLSFSEFWFKMAFIGLIRDGVTMEAPISKTLPEEKGLIRFKHFINENYHLLMNRFKKREEPTEEEILAERIVAALESGEDAVAKIRFVNTGEVLNGIEVKEGAGGRRVVLEVEFSRPIAFRPHRDSDGRLGIDLIDTMYISGGVSEIRLNLELEKDFRFEEIMIGEYRPYYP